MEENLKIKVINHLTGEVHETEVTSAEMAKDLLLELSASETAIKKTKDRLKGYLDAWLGQDQEYKFADGKVLRRVQREVKQWTIEGLKKAGLDEDTIAVVSKVDMTAASQIVKEMVERGELDPKASKTIEEYAELKASKPFVEVR